MDSGDETKFKSDRHQRIDIRVGVERRRKWSDADRLRIVQETLADGAVIADVCRRNEVASSLIYTWRKQAFDGLLAGFHEVRVVPELDAPLPLLPSAEQSATACNIIAPPLPLAEVTPNLEPLRRAIEVSLPDGTVLRTDGDAEHGALRAILASLRHRS